jgi:ATP-dependent Clp protease ATP-binding subunit ClpC
MQRFTDRARKVMALANQEAERFNHEYVGTEHMLLGLIKEGSGVGANALKTLDVDLRKARLEVEKLIKVGPDRVATGKLPQTPRSKRVIEHAIEESQMLGHNYVGTEHLLLGLIRERDGVAARVLMNMGLTLEHVRNTVLAITGEGVATPSEPADPKGGREEFFLSVDVAVVRRIAQAAARESERTGRDVTPGDLIRQALERQFPPGGGDAAQGRPS